MKPTLEITIGGVTYQNCFTYPFNFENVLDATLDSAAITLDRIPVPVFEPLTFVRLSIVTNASGGLKRTSSDWIISSDESYETPVGSGLYHHSISLVEPTKYLEGFICDSLCVTHPGGNIYTDNAQPVTPEES